MSDTATYSVVLSGGIKSGFEPDQVAEAFARLFKVSPEKADSIVGKPFVLKREVDAQLAEKYANKLSEIGIEALVKPDDGAAALSLKPIAPRPSDTSDESTPLGPDEMRCPKCSLRQARTEECTGCGVIVQKVLQHAASPDAAEIVSQHTESDDGQPGAAGETDIESQALGAKLLIAPVVVAVLGALLWYLIAVKLEYEFGLVAWFIGGCIGFAAMISGGRSHQIGVICAVLALFSIVSGKYMAVSAVQSELNELLSGADSELVNDFRAIYEVEMQDAQTFATIDRNDDSIKDFMVSHEYSDFVDASEVTGEGVDNFRAEVAPRLDYLASNRPSFEQWYDYTLGEAMENMSTLDLMFGEFGILDLLFLVFGMGSAYRLASGGKITLGK